MTEGEQREAGCRIGTGRDYPAPIVDHAREREVALERFARLRR
jgi:deoxyribodipyrimidine photo-lyase